MRRIDVQQAGVSVVGERHRATLRRKPGVVGSTQQCAVRQTGPRFPLERTSVVADQVWRQLRGSCSSFRMRKSAHRLVSCFQRRDRLRSGDTRKRVEKLVEAVVSFEVVDQVPERNTRADKNGRAAQNFRVAVNDWRNFWQVGPSARWRSFGVRCDARLRAQCANITFYLKWRKLPRIIRARRMTRMA